MLIISVLINVFSFLFHYGDFFKPAPMRCVFEPRSQSERIIDSLTLDSLERSKFSPDGKEK